MFICPSMAINSNTNILFWCYSGRLFCRLFHSPNETFKPQTNASLHFRCARPKCSPLISCCVGFFCVCVYLMFNIFGELKFGRRKCKAILCKYFHKHILCRWSVSNQTSHIACNAIVFCGFVAHFTLQLLVFRLDRACEAKFLIYTDYFRHQK